MNLKRLRKKVFDCLNFTAPKLKILKLGESYYNECCGKRIRR